MPIGVFETNIFYTLLCPLKNFNEKRNILETLMDFIWIDCFDINNFERTQIQDFWKLSLTQI